jgi:hypothetical protein
MHWGGLPPVSRFASDGTIERRDLQQAHYISNCIYWLGNILFCSEECQVNVPQSWSGRSPGRLQGTSFGCDIFNHRD